MKQLTTFRLLIVCLMMFCNLNLFAIDLITDQVVVNVEKAGTLSTKISDADKFRITNLKITGKMNGADFDFIAEGEGKRLKILDLGEVEIVADLGYKSGIYVSQDNVIPSKAFYSCKKITNIILPSDITFIGGQAFDGCSSLASLVIPDGVTSIGQYAFSGCSGLTSLVIPDGVTSIGGAAFEGCSGLTSLVVPAGVTSIGSSTFRGCSGLTSLVIPDGVTSIGVAAFNGCSGLTSLVVPAGVTSIGQYAFSGCSGLTSLVIPDGVFYIRDCTFNGCSGLTSITLPSFFLSIGFGAFQGCSGLTSLVIPDGVTSIGGAAFEGCSGLTSLVIPDGVTSIGDCTFYGCSGLTSLVIPDGVTSIGGAAFEGCSGLTSLVIPDGVTSIGGAAFEGCSGLTSLVIPDDVTSIGDDTFSGCSGLTSLVIPDDVTSIGGYAFSGCSSLKTIVCKAITPPEQSSWRDIFNNFSRNECVLFVPQVSLEAYKTNRSWKNFKAYKAIEGESEPVTACATPVISYENGKLNFESSTSGAEYHYTIKDGDVVTDKHNIDGNVQLGGKLDISVYATADGYIASEKASATLYWLNAADGETDNINLVKTRGVMVSTDNGITISGLKDGEVVTFYSVSGVNLGSVKAVQGIAHIEKPQENIVIAKINGQEVKIAVK